MPLTSDTDPVLRRLVMSYTAQLCLMSRKATEKADIIAV